MAGYSNKTLVVTFSLVLLGGITIAQDKAFLDRASLVEGWKSNYLYMIRNVSIDYSLHLIDQCLEDVDTDELPEWHEPGNLLVDIYRRGISELDSKRYLWQTSYSDDFLAGGDPIDQYAFDGQNTTYYFANSNSGVIEKGLQGRSVESESHIKPYLLLNRIQSGTRQDEWPEGVPEFIWNWDHARATVLPEMEVISGVTCHVMVAQSPTGNFKHKVWIAHENGMLPMKYMFYRYGELEEETVVEQIGYAESLEGTVWYPKEAVSTRRSRWQGRTTYKMITHSFDFNLELSESDFRVNFPNGARVVDRVAGLEYIAGVERFDEIPALYYIETANSSNADEDINDKATPWEPTGEAESSPIPDSDRVVDHSQDNIGDIPDNGFAYKQIIPGALVLVLITAASSFYLIKKGTAQDTQ